jgi:hypothetical protein
MRYCLFELRTEDTASDIFQNFVQRWLSRGLLEELAEPEDLAHLSNSAVKLNILEEHMER